MGTLSQRNLLTFNHDTGWAFFCLPYDFALRVEIGECDTMSIVLSIFIDKGAKENFKKVKKVRRKNVQKYIFLLLTNINM